MSDAESLAKVFDQPELAWLVDRLVARMEQGKALDCGSVTLAEASDSQRRGIDDLLGRRSTRGQTLSIDLENLCGHLNLDDGQLKSIVTAVRGPVTNRLEAASRENRQWERLFDRWERTTRGEPALERWIEGLRRSGQLKRAAGRDGDLAESLLGQAWQILDRAPHNDILLATLAARISGDSHALDRGRSLAHLCLRAIQERHEIDGSLSADARREAWASLGVTVDDLSAPALCLNLRPAPGSELSPWIDWHLERGEPFYLSWRQVRHFEPDPATDAVFVCENPAIVSEAANRLRASSRPLICLNGVPAGPVCALLKRIADAGIRIHLRADFDWTGLRILDRLHDPGVTQLWRMTAADYVACRPSQELRGSPLHLEWSAELSAVMSETGLAAYEEELIDELLKDLSVVT